MPRFTVSRPRGPAVDAGLDRNGVEAADRLRVAMLSPPWIAVPPEGYGGIESVVALLCDELVRRGHDIVLFAAAGSRSMAQVRPVLERTHEREIGSALHESDFVATAFADIRAGAGGGPFDVVHDHSGFTALAMADQLPVPVVQTLHGPFTVDVSRFYRRHGHKARLVAISRSQRDAAPPGVAIQAVVPNPIDVARWPFRATKDNYVLWAGRMDPVKGADRAVTAARLADVPLVIAGPVQPGQEEFFRTRIEPFVDGSRVQYVGEVAGRKRQELYAGARALLVPIDWEEPFGMVMVEALACGTPVIAFARGAASEIVQPGENGALVADEAQMARAIASIDCIAPARCRWSVRSRFGVPGVVRQYEAVYRGARDGVNGTPLVLAGT